MRRASVAALGALFALFLVALGTGSTAAALSASPVVAPEPNTQTITHTVQAGDTLSRLASQYGVTVEALVELNQIADPNVIDVGQALIVNVPPGWTPAPTSAATPTLSAQAVTHVVQAGDTLSRLARQYGVTVEALVELNQIVDPNVIDVGQTLAIDAPSGWTPPPAQPVGGSLAFTWSMVDWRPADPDYLATINIKPQGGTPPYTYYHDGLVQEGDTFEIAWRRCRPKPGSVGVADASGASIAEDYWLLAPYCPVGVEIVEPEEGAELEHANYHFNITWRHPIDPPPPAYGIEIEYWAHGSWRPWKQYVHKRDDRDLFYVPDAFPGDLGGRVRMWGIYGEHESKSKTPWRYFEFRVTY
jgi:LysM repeat protein